MIEFGRVEKLIRVIDDSSLNESLQGYNRKRAAVNELGNIGDDCVLPILLDVVGDFMLCNSAIIAIGNIKFHKTGEKHILQAIDILEKKIDNGTEFQCSNSVRALQNIAEQRIDNGTIVGKIENVLGKERNNNSSVMREALEAIRAFKELNKRRTFPPPKPGKKSEPKRKLTY